MWPRAALAVTLPILLTAVDHAQFFPDTTSFVAICRLNEVEHPKAPMCEFMIDLGNDKMHEPFHTDHWALCRPNQPQIFEMFPVAFNINQECLSLKWEASFQETQETLPRLRFKLYLTNEFAKSMPTQSCYLHPLSMVSSLSITAPLGSGVSVGAPIGTRVGTPVGVPIGVPFEMNYIEIRFSPSECNEAEDNEVWRHQMFHRVDWSAISLTISKLFSRKHHVHRKRGKASHFQIDITDGFYRWYIWRNVNEVETFLNRNFDELATEFDGFDERRGFIRITSLLLTRTARERYRENGMKQRLLTSDSHDEELVSLIRTIYPNIWEPQCYVISNGLTFRHWGSDYAVKNIQFRINKIQTMRQQEDDESTLDRLEFKRTDGTSSSSSTSSTSSDESELGDLDMTYPADSSMSTISTPKYLFEVVFPFIQMPSGRTQVTPPREPRFNLAFGTEGTCIAHHAAGNPGSVDYEAQIIDRLYYPLETPDGTPEAGPDRKAKHASVSPVPHGRGNEGAITIATDDTSSITSVQQQIGDSDENQKRATSTRSQASSSRIVRVILYEGESHLKMAAIIAVGTFIVVLVITVITLVLLCIEEKKKRQQRRALESQTQQRMSQASVSAPMPVIRSKPKKSAIRKRRRSVTI